MEVTIATLTNRYKQLYIFESQPRNINVFLLQTLQALPIFLDSLLTAWGAILLSVTLILLFGEVSFSTILNYALLFIP